MKKKEEIPAEVREAPEEKKAPEASEEASEQAAGTEPETAVPAEKVPDDAEKLARDVAAFHSLFPDVKAEEIPGEVWERVEGGESLTAAYAVHFVREKREEERIAKLNAENEKAAPPPVRHDGKEESYFSPEAVKAMSRDEVRKNYQEILRSMDHWNWQTERKVKHGYSKLYPHPLERDPLHRTGEGLCGRQTQQPRV